MHAISKISYIAIVDRERLPGVYNKITQTTKSLTELGYDAEHHVVFEGSKLGSAIKAFKLIWFSQADTIIYRHSIYTFLLFFAFIRQRIKETKIIIDIPTPSSVTLIEIYNTTDSSRVEKAIRIALIAATAPWSLWPATKIIQYAPENIYFSLGLRKKTTLSSNGINVNNIDPRKGFPRWPDKNFFLIGVASIANWHAFDRVIRGMAEYNKKSTSHNTVPHFIIVGDGPARKALEDLVRTLNLESQVTFTGYKSGASLNVLYTHAHIGVASLGLYRKGLSMASDLKSREYAARGLPFICAGHDFDFDPTPDFVLKFANNDSYIDIEKTMNWYSTISFDHEVCESIRCYAVERLDFSMKVKEIVE